MTSRRAARAFLGLVAVALLGQPLSSGAVALGQDASLRMTSATFAGLQLRNIGPASRGGRITDIAMDAADRSVWYIATASGGVWKTENRGTTWTPIFDRYGSYSVGTVVIDPNNRHVIWVGTGENNSQRSVGWGDGVYRSLDGGRTFENMGLRESEHIAKILVDPRDSNRVLVASQGPLWAPGGDRGLYRTVDGGANWERILHVSENTGITDVAFDPRDPDVLYAASYQRRRHVGLLIAGGPESRLYKSTDGGDTWRMLTTGLPSGELGRIGIAVSPQNPDVLYATIPTGNRVGAFYRSSDRGESWTAMSDHQPGDPQYYQELFPDPHRFDRVYSVAVMLHRTDDGGATFEALDSTYRHVDNHAVAFDPDDPDYLMVGNDGGLYESFDAGVTWKHFDNLLLTQFYRVGIDNDTPFYNLYGGTQDNDTLGGPSRTNNIHGVRNSDWFITQGGDGFQTRVDPDDPNIVYSQSQYAGIVRYDRRTGERVDIQPQAEPGEAALRWHWDSPLIISPHAGSTLYYASNRVFRSDDRAQSWTPVSPDLSRRLNRNERAVMGRSWSVDAVWRNVFTSPYGTVVALDESPIAQGLLYAGTDDGLIQVSEDGGGSWRTTSSFPGVPDLSYVSDVHASRHDADVVFATFNNHKEGDFAPYVLRSDDRGVTWTSIAGDLPDGHVAWSLVQDDVEAQLLFLGTEFALYFSRDGGTHWIALTGGVPTIAFRDLEIHAGETDLVGASFGRGFFILDDYSPLRVVNEDALSAEAALLPVKDPWMYLPAQIIGFDDKGEMGHDFFNSPNPEFGAVLTYYLRDGLVSRRDARRAAELAALETGAPIAYPDWDELRAEEREVAPAVVLTVRDQDGNIVRRITGPTTPGMHRVAWDLRWPSATGGGGRRASGPLAVPGSYTATLALAVDGELRTVGAAQSFEARPLGSASLPNPDRAALLAFHRQLGHLQRALVGTDRVVAATLEQIGEHREALAAGSEDTSALATALREVEVELLDVQTDLRGDATITRRAELAPPGLLGRVQRAVGEQWSSTSEPTAAHRRNYEIAAEAFGTLHARLIAVFEERLPALYRSLDAAGVPWTAGRPLPQWTGR